MRDLLILIETEKTMKFNRIISIILCVFLLAGAVSFEAFAENEGAAIPAGDGTAAESGIIDGEFLKQAIEEYADANNMRGGEAEFSVGYIYTATGDSWYYNGDAWYYSASLYKIPVTMLMEEKELAGEINRDSIITSQYATDTVEQMEYKSIVYSNNYTGHAMVEYLGGTYNGKCSDQTIKFTDLPESYFDQNFFDVSYYSARYYTKILETIYKNQDRFPHIIDYMKQANKYMCDNPSDIGKYLSNNGVGDQYAVAQKYGSYVEAQGTGDDNKHAAGIIYTPNPVIITVMTKNITNYERKIGDISSILVNYTLTLDSKVEAYEAEKARLAKEAEEAAKAAEEEQKRIEAAKAAAEEAARQAKEEADRLAEELARKEAVKQKITKTLMIVGGIILAIAILAIVAIKVINGLKSGSLSKSKKSKAGKKKSYDDYYDDDDSEYDDYDEEDFDEFDEDEDDLPKRKQKAGFGKQKAASVISGLIPKKSASVRGKSRVKSEPEDLYDDDEDDDDYYERSARYTPKAAVRYEPDEMEPMKPAAGSRRQEYLEEDDDYGYDEEIPDRKPQKNSRSSRNTGKYIPKH